MLASCFPMSDSKVIVLQGIGEEPTPVGMIARMRRNCGTIVGLPCDRSCSLCFFELISNNPRKDELAVFTTWACEGVTFTNKPRWCL
jgi:hypothetical protein